MANVILLSHPQVSTFRPPAKTLGPSIFSPHNFFFAETFLEANRLLKNHNADLFVCDFMWHEALSGSFGHIPIKQQVPTVLIAERNALNFVVSSGSINVVGRIGVFGQHLKPVWERLCNALTCLEENKAKKPFTHEAFKDAYAKAPEPHTPWSDDGMPRIRSDLVCC